MTRIKRFINGLAVALVIGASLFLAAQTARADMVYLKSGEVLDGTIDRDEADFVVVKITKDGKTETRLILRDDIKRIERTSAAKDPVAPAKPEAKPEAKPTDKPSPEQKPAENAKSDAKDDAKDAKDEAKKDDKGKKRVNAQDKALTGRATRVAILNFGDPARYQGKNGDMVGVHISSKAFADVVPMLEKAGVDVVVIHVNSGGGYTLEMGRFADLFHNTYKKKFRTAAWIESAISAAAMSPWVIEEFYMQTNGNIGACTEWHGNLVASKGIQLEERLVQMEKVSILAGRDPKIMRAMQIQEPLSCTIDENGNVSWFQDTSGKILVNRPGEVLTMNSELAVKTKFAKGIADTPAELMKVMGITEYEIVALDVSKYMDRYSDDAQRVEDTFRETVRKYLLARNTAESLPRDRRAPEVGRARKFLNELKKMVALNPNFQFHFAGQVGAELDDEFFEGQERILKKLLQ